MRITFLTPFADMAGGSRVIHIHAEALRRRGHVVTLITRPQPRMALRKRLRSFLQGRGWPPAIRLVPSYFDDAKYPIVKLETVRSIAVDDVPDADFIIATWWETAEWMMRMPPEKGRWIHLVQGYEAFENMPKQRVDDVLSAPTFKIAISKWLTQLLHEKFDNSTTVLVPNGVDLDQFHAPPRSRNLTPTIGMLYSTVKSKDCATGFRAFELLRRRLPRVQLLTFGASQPIPELPLPQGTRHVTLPAQQDIKKIYASCDVWLCPSRAEGFGLPQLEAMACRCPVISTPVGWAIDEVKDFVNGHLVPIGDSLEMANTLERFFALSDVEWLAQSDAAYATATRYGWENATDRFEQALYEAAAI